MFTSQAIRTAMCVAVALSLVSVPASAQVLGPVYPAPGGNTFAGSGNSRTSAGAEGRYSGFNANAFDDLYWTYTSILNPYWNPTGPTGTMAFQGYNSTTGVSTWQSTANLTFTDVFGTSHSTPTVFSVQFQPFDTGVNGLMGSGFLVPTTLSAAGITPGPGQSGNQSVFADALGNNFQVWSQYTTASGTPLAVYYDSFQHSGDQFSTSSSGGFYYTEQTTTTPEPTSVVLLATGLAGVFGSVRRRRNTAAAR